MRRVLVLVICLAVSISCVVARPKNRKLKHQRGSFDTIDPCYDFDCPKGRQCFLNTTTGLAECMCRPSCKKHINPVCGSDGILYDNHCELHRAACLTGHHISIMHGVTCSKPTTIPPMPPITPVASTTMAKKVVTEEETLKVSTVSAIADTRTESDSSLIFEVPTKDIIERNCSKADYEEFKSEVLAHYREQFKNPADEVNPSLPPMNLKFLISFLFNHLDTDKDDKLTLDELRNALTADGLQYFSTECTMEEFMGADRNKDNRLVAPELYDVFGIQPISIADELKEKTVTARAGTNIVLDCDVDTNYNLKMIWERNGVAISEKKKYDGVKLYHGDDDRLYIVNLKLLHTGEYSCYAAAYPNVRQVVMVTVEVPPSVTVCPHNQLTPRGSSAKVQCYAQGVPTPSKFWTQNQNPLEVGDKYQLDDSNSSLMIHHIDYADTGIFDCSATNDVGTKSLSGSVFIRDSSSSIDFSSNNVYYFFHKFGIQVLDPETCAFQESFHADSQLPDDNHLCHVNKTTGERECNWGSAVNVKNRYIYATQPTEYRIIVIDLRLREIIEVMKTDKMPVSLTYVPHLDTVWIESWRNKNRLTGLHGVKVIRSASEPPIHYTIHLEPSGNHFDVVESVHIPTEQIAGQGEMLHGYIIHRDQQGLSKIDLRSLTHQGRVNLREYNCHPNSVSFVAIGGYVIVNCEATEDEQEKQLFVDYITDEVIRVNEGVQGQVYVTPDGRYVISVDRAEQHIQVQKVTDDGQVKTDFQVSTNLHISDLGFYPTMSSHAYDLIATSRNREEAIYINLETGKVEMISGMHQPISKDEWMWDSHNRKIASSGLFGPYMVSPSADHVIILNGQYRRLHCDVDHLVKANVFAWVGVC